MPNKIFIASSKEKREYARNIAGILSDQQNCILKPLPWYDSAFKPGENYLEALTRIGKSIQGAIIILTKDDEVRRTPDNVRIKPRDNLILECGFFLGMCGPKRTLIVKEEDAQLPSDLDGITCIPLRDTFNLGIDLSKWCLKLIQGNHDERPLIGRWIYYLRCESFDAYGRFDVEKDRDQIKMVNGIAYYAYGPANPENTRGTWHSETVIIKGNDLKALYKMKIVKKPLQRQEANEYTGAFILNAIHLKTDPGQLKGRFSYLTEVDPNQGAIHACKIGELSDPVDERNNNLPKLIKNRLSFDVLNRRRICDRRKQDRRNQSNQALDEIDA